MRHLGKVRAPPHQELPPDRVPGCGMPLPATLPQGQLPQGEIPRGIRAHLVPGETDGMRLPELKEVIDASQ